MEDTTNDFDFESAKSTDSERLSGMAGLDEVVSWPSANSERVQRLWGIADTTATAGHLFSFTVPSDAFSGEIVSFEVRITPKIKCLPFSCFRDFPQAALEKGKTLPRWLLFQTSNGQFEGVPDASDVGEVYVRVQAWGAKGDVARDVFAINVVPKTSYQIPECDAGQDRLQISVLVDAQLKNIGPKSRVAAVRNLAGFLSVSPVSYFVMLYQ
jgi:Putative Ig domain